MLSMTGGLQSGQHALLLSSSRERTWEPIIDHSKEDGSLYSRLIEQLEHRLHTWNGLRLFLCTTFMLVDHSSLLT